LKISEHGVATGDISDVLSAVNGNCHSGIGTLEIEDRKNPAFQSAQAGAKPVGVFNTADYFEAIEPGQVLGMFAGEYMTLNGESIRMLLRSTV
jgi:hypothetical protein